MTSMQKSVEMVTKHMKLYRIIGILLAFILLVQAVPAMAQNPSSHKLDINQIGHIYQDWNNCGGATISMALSYFGYPGFTREDQYVAQDYLKPNREDQNVSPWQMANFVNTQVGSQYNVRAIVRRGGDQTLLKTLLAANFPIVIEKGYEVDSVEGWMGHYLLMVGYDDALGVFFTYDSFLGAGFEGQGREESYEYIDTYWRHFNNTFIVLYQPEREAELQTLMGEMWLEDFAWSQALETAQQQAAENPNDYWAWFNLGEAAAALEQYDVATVAYNQAINSGQMPWRTLWYLHGAFESFYQTGDYEMVLRLAENLQAITPYIEEANYYRGLVYAAQGNTDQAIYRLNLVLDFNPNFYLAAQVKAEIEAGTFVPPMES